MEFQAAGVYEFGKPIQQQAGMEGFAAAQRNASASHNRRVLEAARLYADGGVDDPTTGITYNFILSGDSAGVLFGEVDPSYTTGVLSGSAPDTTAIVNIIPGAS